LPKPSHRKKLLEEGLKVLLSRGYNGASVRDVVRAAGVPQGSFTNHFKSKAAFSEEVLENYFLLIRGNIEKTLRNDALRPLRRLRGWFDLQIGFLKQTDFQSGCLIGNFSAEAGDENVSIRRRLVEISKEIQKSLFYCLKAAAAAGEMPPAPDLGEIASFLNASWQGAILQSKIERSSRPLENFKSVLFERVLGVSGRRWPRGRSRD
jgi:TetR/AcrR family transcriptional repressor of nem operon